MSGWKVFLTVVIVLVVIGLLIGGGFGLYRLGYVQGVAAAAAGADNGQLLPLYGWGMHGYRGGPMQGWPYGGMMSYGGHMPFGMFGFGGWFVGLLLLAGVVTLIVLGIRALTHGRPAEVLAAPAAPAIVEPTAAQPTRGAKKS